MLKHNILIIDDSMVDQKLMSKVLCNSNENIEIIECSDGENIEAIISEMNVKVIILDLMIYDIDGLDILYRLKDNPKTKSIPVIVCSSITEQTIIRETLIMGAYDYFEKPFSDIALKFSLAVKVKNALDMRLQWEYIAYLNSHDTLTGLYTRSHFEGILTEAVKCEMLPVSVIIIDINGLKIINDAYGHDVGDRVLKEIGITIRNKCEPEFSVARWGSDEFVIFLPNKNKLDVQNIITGIRTLITERQQSQYDISFGWATESKKSDNIKYLVQRSEDKLYSNKILEAGSIRSKMIESIIHTLHQKNPREEMHSQRVSHISMLIATELGFSDFEIKRVKLAGLMHDIGKIAISEEILNKSGKLDTYEWNQIKKHPEYGFKILSTSIDTLEIANAVLAHHERCDGKGYPKGISGSQIPIMAKIIAVADTFDAMTSLRTYRETATVSEAVEEIKRCSGTQFDPLVVEAFSRFIEKPEQLLPENFIMEKVVI